MISYGSLCTGYDGIGLGLELAGVSLEHRWHAELDDAMSGVLKHEHPDVVNVRDIKTAPWHLAPRVDLMSSGDPCQSISVAGRQQGRKDPRFLWPYVRTAYRAVRPGAVFLENVANIVSHDGGRTLAERLTHLRADGYAVRWTVLGACAVGAPHCRHRWYAVAGYAGAHAPAAVRVGGPKAICGAPRSGGRVLLPSPCARDGDGRGEGGTDYWQERRDGVGRTNGMPLGAAVNLLPTPSAADGTGGPGESPRRSGGPNLRTAATLLPTPRATDGPNGGPNQRNGRGEYDALPGLVTHLLPTPTTSNTHGNDKNSRGELLLPGVATRPEVWGKYADAVALWESITGVPAPAPTGTGPRGGLRLSATLPEWMMGLRPGMLTERLSRSDALKGAGNGVVPLACAAAWRLLTERA